MLSLLERVKAPPVPPCTATALQRLWSLPKNKTLSKKEQAPHWQSGTEAEHSRCQACGLFVLTGQTWNRVKDAKSLDRDLEPELPLVCLLPGPGQQPVTRSLPWTPAWDSAPCWYQNLAPRSRQGLRASPELRSALSPSPPHTEGRQGQTRVFSPPQWPHRILTHTCERLEIVRP